MMLLLTIFQPAPAALFFIEVGLSSNGLACEFALATHYGQNRGARRFAASSRGRQIVIGESVAGAKDFFPGVHFRT